MSGGGGDRHPPGGDRTVFDANPIIAPRAPGARQIRIGDVLNHIYEVRRFIARGGMGEVFEGINVTSDERVAIKVILHHLAADPTVQAMFRKEARTLTRLRHPSIVQYRVLANEPQLGTFYIVTEYIDGPNLSDRLGSLDASPEQILRLLRKLAEGLNAAHALGAIHRDIAPDNIMLEGGQLDHAKLIDFGIAKDLNATAGQTIIGDGFAGKLNYVAPEQLGDFNREIGPWSDVYSLGLTILAVALGRDVNMGATLVEAVDKRRGGVDLSGAPAELRPVLERMLAPNPAARLRSMGEVLDLLNSQGLVAALPRAADGRQGLAAVERAGEAGFLASLGQRLAGSGLSRRHLAIGAGGLAVVLAIVSGAALLPGDETGQRAAPAAPTRPVAAAVNPAQIIPAARAAIEAELPSIPCSWLELADVSVVGGNVALALRGVSGRSGEAVNRLEDALKRRGLRASAINFDDVSSIRENTCRPLEAFAEIRQPGASRLQVEQRKFEMGPLPASEGADAGKIGGQAVITFDLAGLGDEVSVVGLDEAGEIMQVTQNKAELVQNADPVGPDRYRITLNTLHSGWSGILMLIGKGPFPPDLLTSASGSRNPDWAARFLKAARERNWKAEMVWYRTVDEIKETGGAARSVPSPAASSALR